MRSRRLITPSRALMHGMAYTPYGYRAGDEAAVLLGFNGQCRDRVTGGYLLGNGHRLYSSAIMRFLSSDSLSPFGAGGINCYAYCFGDPINFHDSSGRAPTGLSKLLVKLDLPKPELRDYLKPLGRLNAFKQKLQVYRLKDVEFETFEFMGAGKKIMGRRGNDRSAMEAYVNSESFYRSGDLYIPKSTVPQEAEVGLLKTGFELIKFDTHTFADTMLPGGASAQTGRSGDRVRLGRDNDYANDPVAAVARTRTE
ncbi:hypothetical protein PAGU2196_51790 [Pseudomonas sp. PAGU 2196]|uniref:RHS repeat-associated core domain-containing protein n=1 Tax=Pseudomonas sp. PAGU 2196 TaxID=2793997 RepID=UPI001EE00FE0|nr:RHS repeat-associated core domain-containing protein [Pseudomonas sp. PAGU 2196]GHS84345.1 hypothetical protein PAGU2196_51790 [Pseudomonas sp. PAGU 2196]